MRRSDRRRARRRHDARRWFDDEKAKCEIPGDQEPRDKRVPLPAVGWLLGPELIANLRAILRRTAHRTDSRTWMAPHPHTLHDEYSSKAGTICYAANCGTQDASRTAKSEVWFDYIADSGDSCDAMYAVAVACQVDLQLGAPGESLPTSWQSVEHHDVHVCGTCKTDQGRGNLPRGQFLMWGGDTAYHVADEITVRNRVARPFNWAYQDLEKRAWQGQHDPQDPRTCLLSGGQTRMYGLPGNHDWYNDLHGFSMLFLGPKDPPIPLLGFQPQQQASYVALQLPYDWQLWGLDIDFQIDDRQCEYFQSLMRDRQSQKLVQPEKLILCTPSPPVVFHRACPPDEHDEALRLLELSPAYDCAPAGAQPADKCSIPDGRCRLDLAGDVHHYARYRWPGSGGDDRAASYMAVVAGLGGAFHHPTFTRAGGLKPAVEYPTADQSLKKVAPLLLHWRSLISGSWIRAFPIVFGLILAFGSTSKDGAGWLLSRALSALTLGAIRPCGDAGRLGTSLLLLGTLAVTGGLIYAAVRLFHHAYNRRLDRARDNLPPSTNLFSSYIPCTAAVVLALLVLYSLHLCNRVPTVQDSLLDIGATLVVLLGVAGGSLLASLYGAKLLPLGRRLALGALGLVHGIAQIATPLIFARLIELNLMVPVVFAAFVAWWLAVRQPMAQRKRPALAPAVAGIAIAAAIAAQLALDTSLTPLVAGAAIVATWLLLVLSRKLFDQTMLGMLLIKAVWITAWFGAIAALVWATHGDAPSTEHHPFFQLAQFAAGAILATPLCLAYFSWYLAIAGLANAHNNEVGGAARVTAFRQLIRFRVHAGGVTGYVIAIEDGDGTVDDSPARDGGEHLAFKLVDVFTIAPPAAKPVVQRT